MRPQERGKSVVVAGSADNSTGGITYRANNAAGTDRGLGA